mgnify:CR=1 FL=1
MTKIISGTELAKKLRGEIKEEATALREKGIEPTLAVVLVGDNKASRSYVNSKHKACIENNINSVKIELDENISTASLLNEIEKLNNDSEVHGILVQLPLPKQIDSQTVLEAIIPEKDVDGFHPVNLGKLLQKDESIVPCTPKGIIRLLEEYEIDLTGKEMVVIGQSTIVGRPMALLGLNRGATVTVCHSRTKDLEKQIARADIIISAVGKPNLVKKEYVKKDAVIIDVGINRLESGKLVGDVDFDGVKDHVSAITPVPGGVGPMTIAMLLEQTYLNACKWENIYE